MTEHCDGRLWCEGGASMMNPMPRQRKRRLLRLGLAVGLLLLIAIGWQVSGGPRGWTTHQARIEDGAPHPELQPRRFSADPSQVLDAIEQLADEHPRWRLVGHSRDAGRIHLVLERTTRLFRFVDDIRLQLTPEGVGTVVTGESRSRVGIGDLGQNARNLRELLSGVESRVERNAPTES